MAAHSSITAWTILWAEEPGGIQSMGSQSRTRLGVTVTVTFQSSPRVPGVHSDLALWLSSFDF